MSKAARFISTLAKKAHIDISKYEMRELIQGYNVELEHNTDKNKPEIDVVKSVVDPLKIAIAHLDEDPHYYKKLATLGL